MLLTYQLALVALDDEGGIGPEADPAFDIGLAGGLFLELALSGCVDLDDGTIAVRHGDFADKLLKFTVLRLAGRTPSGAAQLLSEIVDWPGGMRRAVFESMGSQGLGTHARASLQTFRFIPSAKSEREELLWSLEAAAATLDMPGDSAPLLALALASGAWFPPEPEPGEPEPDPNLMQITVDKVPRFVRAPVAAIIQAVAELTLKAHGLAPVDEPVAEVVDEPDDPPTEELLVEPVQEWIDAPIEAPYSGPVEMLEPEPTGRRRRGRPAAEEDVEQADESFPQPTGRRRRHAATPEDPDQVQE